ncbi:MAG: hypothetical protein [Circular genetic element sp.]|nr:MAG: hypothetical protein [Circular genetic element sp.]
MVFHAQPSDSQLWSSVMHIYLSQRRPTRLVAAPAAAGRNSRICDSILGNLLRPSLPVGVYGASEIDRIVIRGCRLVAWVVGRKN